MSQLDDLNAVIDSFTSEITDVGANVTEVLVLLSAAQSSGTAPDLTSAIAKLTSAKTALDTVDASLKAVEPAPPVPPTE